MAFCSPCGRQFGDSFALDQHLKSSIHTSIQPSIVYITPPTQTPKPRCGSCRRVFVDSKALGNHINLLHASEFICNACNNVFRSKDALVRHLNSIHAPKFPCDFCGSTFMDLQAMNEHIDLLHAPDFICDACNIVFGSEDALVQHLNSSVHAPLNVGWDNHLHSSYPIYVTPFSYNQDFVNQTAFDMHLRAPNINILSYPPTFCSECNRHFVDKTALSQHLSSVVHKPISKNLGCILSECRRAKRRPFNCPSGLLHHLESGACGTSGMNRHRINQIVLNNDPGNIITHRPGVPLQYSLDNCERVVGGSALQDSIAGNPRSSSSSSSSSPRSSNSTSTVDEFLVASRTRETDLASRLTCPNCPSDRKPFINAKALQQHISSPAHAPKIFHCPLPPVLSICGAAAAAGSGDVDDQDQDQIRSFSTVSGLTQHIESGACAEGPREMFERALSGVTRRLRGIGFGDLH